MYHKDTTRNLSFYHKDTPWIPKETMRYPRGTQWPMTINVDLYIVILVEKEVITGNMDISNIINIH
jgi:hypothetical protein